MARATPIEVEFSEAMRTTGGTVLVEPGGLMLTPTFDTEARTATFTPTAPLAAGTRYTVTVSTGFADLSGNMLASPFAFSFTTIDDAPPTVLSSTPAEGATGVGARLSTLEVVFSEPMNVSMGSVTVMGGPGTAGAPTWASMDRVRIPLSGLAYETAYSLRLDGFQDAAGNALDGMPVLVDGAVSFTTGADIDAPRVASTMPMEGQQDVNPDTLTQIVVVFDEPMTTTTTAAMLDSGAIMVSLTGTWSADARTITFAMPPRLAYGAAARLTLTGYLDAAGNALDGVPVIGDGALDFVVGADAFSPHVVSSTPAEGAMTVAVSTTEAVLVFSEAMDSTLTTVPATVGAMSRTLTGVWSAGDTTLTVALGGPLTPSSNVELDVRALEDTSGNPVDAAHVYLADGTLDFRTAAPTGEDCTQPLEVADGTTVGGVTTWTVASTSILRDDGGTSACDPTGTGPDVVIHYRKTTADTAGGGRVLRVRADSATTTGFINLQVLSGACVPGSAGATQLKCNWTRRAWDALLDVGPGDYFIWVGRDTSTGAFQGATVSVDEISTVPEGENCSAPLTTTSTYYTAPAGPGAPHRWVIPQTIPDGTGTREPIRSFDMDVTWGGGGSVACDNNATYGDIHGPDAVVRFDKTSATSVLEVRVDATSTTTPNLSVEVADACDTRPATTNTLRCGAGASEYFLYPSGAAGPVFIWIAPDGTQSAWPGATIEIREIEPMPGEACASGTALALGPNAVSSAATQRIDPPSCFGATSNVRWYAVDASMDISAFRANGGGNVALVDAASGRTIECGDASGVPFATLAAAGTRLCVAVEAGAALTSIDHSALAYTGVRDRRTALNVERPLSSGGTAVTITGVRTMALTPTTAYLNLSGTSVLEFPKTGNAVAIQHDMADGLGAANLGYGIATFGETLLSLDDSASAGASSRVFQLWDASTIPWTPRSWDNPAASYPATGMRAVTSDGTTLFYATYQTGTTTTSLTSFYSVQANMSAGAVALGTTNQVRNVLGMAADATYLYLCGTTRPAATNIEGLYRLPRATLATAAPVLIAPLDFGTSACPVQVDSTSNASVVYVRDNAGIHAVVDPDGAVPVSLLITTLGDTSDYPMAYDPADGSLIVFESETVSTGTFWRLR